MIVELAVVSGPENGKTFSFDQPDCFLFGRALDARISLPVDPYVSRQHFLLEISPPDCKISDLNSKNGTFVNNVRYGGWKTPDKNIKIAPEGRTETPVRNGDEISVGDTVMKVTIRAGAACVECGKPIPADKRDECVFIGGTFLCDGCRAKAAAGERSAPDKKTVRCVQCGKDATEEAGRRGQCQDAEYICQACRDQEAMDPMSLLDALLQAAVSPKTKSVGPEFPGYKVEKEIGRGGMGAVYKAVEDATGRLVAVKTMLPGAAADESCVNAFMREIAVTRQLTHPNVAALYDHGKVKGTFFFVLEYVDGPDLDKFRVDQGGKIDLATAAPIMIGALEGLGYAHRAEIVVNLPDGETRGVKGVVHRDIKPQNILLSGKGLVAKIADFGLSKSFETAGLSNHTVPGQIAGTPIYWPREQITHYIWLDPATDVFSIAAVFYELLTGEWVREGFRALLEKCKQRMRPPGLADYFQVIGDNRPIPLRDRNPDIPKAVAQVFDRALREEPVAGSEMEVRHTLSRLRYKDAVVFKDALVDALKKEGLM